MTKPVLIDTQGLPTVARRLVAIIGVDKTYRLLQARGGQRTCFPTTNDRDSPLVGIIGREAVSALARDGYFSGSRRFLPMIDKLIVQLRNAEIRALRKQFSNAELSARFNLTPRMIQYIGNNDTEQDDPTLDMFADTGTE